MLKGNFYLILLLLLFSACKKDPEIREHYDIFLIIGQSNTENGYGLIPSVDYADDGVLQLGRNNGNDMKIIKACEPLDNWDPRAGRIGFAMTFAKMYNQTLPAKDKKVLLIPCGKGSSGFNNSDWNRGDVLYNDAVERVLWVLKNFPGSQLKAILWQQGEQDVGNPLYEQQLDAMVVNFRKDIQADVPFLAGGMVPYWTMRDNARQVQESIIKGLPARLPKAGFIDPLFPFVIEKPDNSFDEIHFDAAGQRELGRRYFEVYREFFGK